MRPKQIREWQRRHSLQPPVRLRIVTSPVSGWLVRVDGWEFPERFPLLYASLEAAQRAADDVLIANCSHDCGQVRCGEWVPFPDQDHALPCPQVQAGAE